MLATSGESGKLASGIKKSHSSVRLDVKLDIIIHSKSGDRAVGIARHLGLPPTTVHTIVKNSESLLEKAKTTPNHSSM